jgi:hypothetical protein
VTLCHYAQAAVAKVQVAGPLGEAELAQKVANELYAKN